MRAARPLASLLAAVLGLTVGSLAGCDASANAADATVQTLPEFPHRQAADWLNGPPLASTALRGHPVLIEFWTFECSNCLATLPWLRAVAARYRRDGLIVVGVHTPELREEYDRAAVRRAVSRLQIDYPVMIDEDYSFWRALDNHYWPAFYLYDANGQLIASRFGEQHVGDARSAAFEQRIAAAVADRSAVGPGQITR